MSYSIDFANLDFSYVGLPELISIATLLVTAIGITFGWRSYKHQVTAAEKDWSITKVDDNLWLLERELPKLATIEGAMSGALCNSFGIQWLNPAGAPLGYFERGDSILIKTNDLFPGANFTIYYKEHSKKKKSYRPNFTNITAGQPFPYEKYKEWRTTLY